MDEGTRKDNSPGMRIYTLIQRHGFILESFGKGFKNVNACDLAPRHSDLQVWGGTLV